MYCLDESTLCQKFDGGQYNDIVYAYLVCAMRDAKTPPKHAENILESLHALLDECPSKEVLERFRGC